MIHRTQVVKKKWQLQVRFRRTACIKQISRPRLKKGQRRFLACGVKVKIRTKNSRYKILSSMARMRGCILFFCPNKLFFRTRCGKGSPCMVSALGFRCCLANQNLLLTAASKESDESRCTCANFHFLIQWCISVCKIRWKLQLVGLSNDRKAQM